MFSFLKLRNDRLLKEYYKLLQIINEKGEIYKQQSDNEIQILFNKIKSEIQNIILVKNVFDNKHLRYKDLLTSTFAIVREASQRTLNMRHFDVQIIGGLILNDGKISEMKTGEGKTLVTALPATFNAMIHNSVHIVTVNDYLCQRDFETMKPIYNFLGLTIGCVNSNTSLDSRILEYSKNIVHVTNNEVGFDYLRDNMKDVLTPLLKNGFKYAIVDEIDSILIDEARTPLIISGPLDIPIEIYKVADKIVKQLDDTMFEIDEKTKHVHLKDHGYDKIESLLQKYNVTKENEFIYGSHYSGVETKQINLQSQDPDFYIKAGKIMNCISQSLKANKIFKDGVDYITKDSKIQIVDEFTGRIMDGRRYSDGLHQAIEAKHNVPILQETQTLASTSYQNLFRMYKKLSGMTGTAKTEEDEFISIYGLDVISVPTNKKMCRNDMDDLVYTTKEEKYKAITQKVKSLYEKGQPVLIGTVSIEKSEILSKYFKDSNIPHNVLNAKNHAKEAEIISQAGKLKSVTIATNMAGRGTDIILGGNVEYDIKRLFKESKTKDVENIKYNYQQDNLKVKELGGLFILGSERHESRRIDDQLRGRAGRQGDPGASQFYLSLEDDLLRIFGGEKIKNLLLKVGLKKDEVVNHSFLNTIIRKAQEKIENYNFDIRKNLLKFDDVINEQRTTFYKMRRQIVENPINVFINIASYYNDFISDIQKKINTNYFTSNMHEGPSSSNIILLEYIAKSIPVDYFVTKEELEKITDYKALFEKIQQSITNLFNTYFKNIELEDLNNIHKSEIFNKNLDKIKTQEHKHINEISAIKSMTLHILDNCWKDHLHSIDNIRSSIALRSFAQKDPLNEYKIESYQSFDQMFERYKSISLLSFFIHINNYNRNILKS